MLYQAHVTFSGDSDISSVGRGVSYGQGRIHWLRALGMKYTTEYAEFDDISVRVKLVGTQNFIHVEAQTGGYLVFPTSKINPAGVVSIGAPPGPVTPYAVIKKIKKDDATGEIKLSVLEHKTANAGGIDWQSEDGKNIVTFSEGSTSRYGNAFGENYLDSSFRTWNFVLDRFIYFKNKKIDTNKNVAGVCFINSKKYGSGFIVAHIEYHDLVEFYFIAKGLDVKIGQFQPTDGGRCFSPWHFNFESTKVTSIAFKDETASTSVGVFVTFLKARLIVGTVVDTELDLSISANYEGGWTGGRTGDPTNNNSYTESAETIDAMDCRVITEETIESGLFEKEIPFGADFVDGIPSILKLKVKENNYSYRRTQNKTSYDHDGGYVVITRINSGPTPGEVYGGATGTAYNYIKDGRVSINVESSVLHKNTDLFLFFGEKKISEINSQYKNDINKKNNLILIQENETSITYGGPPNFSVHAITTKHNLIIKNERVVNLIGNVSAVNQEVFFCGLDARFGSASVHHFKNSYSIEYEETDPSFTIANTIHERDDVKNTELIVNFFCDGIEVKKYDIYNITTNEYLFQDQGYCFFKALESSCFAHRKKTAIFSLAVKELIGSISYALQGIDREKSYVIGGVKNQNGTWTFEDVKTIFSIGDESEFSISPIRIY